jgi:uncharacterized protein YndB with AHSA1/START domain/DNA-binding transcriptional ArsR family regulator
VTDDSKVFRALADPTRRGLLDRLFERDGRTLTELEATAADMTRFGVMKHLRLLEEAGLINTRKEGRQKLHFLNPVPIRLLHDRWINKYAERPVAALTDLKHALENPMTDAAARTTQIYDVYIKAEPEKIWTAITDPDFSARYGYRGATHAELHPGGRYEVHANEKMRSLGLPEVIIDGEVVEADAPRKLVHTYRWLFSDDSKAEGFTRVTWEIAPTQSGFTRLTVTHELAGAPGMAAMTASQFNEQGSGGWGWILSDLKSLLETGQAMSF